MKLIKKSITHLIIINTAWTVLIIVSLFYNIYIVNNYNTQLVKNVAAAFFREIQVTRGWNASHEGVYVPITEKTQPNQYLPIKNRDITTTTGLKLTKINPAFMTRQISEINALKKDNIQFHLTSLNPIRPKNKPFSWEVKALHSFEKGKKSYFAFNKENQDYRYMGPLWVEEACLKCHAQQGYKLGEIRGGISVIIPKGLKMGNDDLSITSLTIMHIIVWFIGIVISILFWKYRERQLKILSDEQNITKEQNIVLEDTKIKAEEASVAKSEFLSSMSHELRTPINGILGAVEILQDTEVSLEQKKLLHIASNSGKKLLNLISDILDLSKVEAGKMELDTVDFNIFKTVEDIVAVHALSAGKNSVDFILEIDPKVPRLLNGDLVRICQILNNFCSNAVKFTKEGQIKLIVNLDKNKDENKDKVWLRFVVKDSGVGISKEDQKKIFSNFTQADSSTTRKYGGTGLGLAISKKLTELMGGGIGLQSEVGCGSEFYFIIPLKILQNKQVSKDDEKLITESSVKKAHSTEKLKILLAEDDLINQKIAKIILEKLNYSVDIANNGKEAVSKIQTFNYDILLMDCQMPEMDGYEATRKIRELEAGEQMLEIREKKSADREVLNANNKEINQKSQILNNRIPIIAMTANALAGDREKCLESGMDDYITKPINKKLLKDKIDHWTRKKYE